MTVKMKYVYLEFEYNLNILSVVGTNLYFVFRLSSFRRIYLIMILHISISIGSFGVVVS